jgi:hypothetical protein
MSHEHDFMDCGYDEQQCDSECKSNWHKCSVCGKSRSQIAKEQPEDVLFHVIDCTGEIIVELQKVHKLKLAAAVELIKECAKQLDWLSRERLVEMAVWEQQREAKR